MMARFSPRDAALLTAAASLFVILSCAAAATPMRGWASAGKVLDLQPNGSVSAGTAIDRLMIQDAFARWGLAFDEGRLDVVASLFTQDARYRVLNASPTPIVTLDGLPAILEGVRRAMANESVQRRHVITNVVIDQLTPTTARAAAYGVVVDPDNPIAIGGVILYTGNLVLKQGVWKFSQFVIGTDAFATPIPNLSHK